MIRLLALADTHLNGRMPHIISSRLAGADLLVHAGDFTTIEALRSLEELGQVEAVCGNSDSPALRRILPERRVFEAEGFRVGIVHQASLSRDLLGPIMLAREMEADILIFGHIHRPLVEEIKGRLILCPGSPTLPRMSPPTIAEIIIEDGHSRGKIIPLGEPICDYLRYASSLSRDPGEDKPSDDSQESPSN
ncbi:MAG: metallophosphoesterase [Methanotrichaceae archaeon]|nr:metallophosphoesterase [Methanotrichaceae archaeon]